MVHPSVAARRALLKVAALADVGCCLWVVTQHCDTKPSKLSLLFHL